MKLKLYNKELSYSFCDLKKSYLVTLHHGNTEILTSVNIGNWIGYGTKRLHCEYRERAYAANKIPPGFTKHEPKLRPHEAYRSGLVEKSLESIVSPSFRFEIKISVIVGNYETGSPIDSLIINSCYIAMKVSGIPCSSFGCLQASFIKKWDLGDYGDKKILVSGDEFNISLLEAHNINDTQLKDAVHFLYIKMRSLIEFHNDVVDAVNKKQIRQTYIPQEPSCIEISAGRLIKACQSSNMHELRSLEQDFTSKFSDKLHASYHWHLYLGNVLKAHMLHHNKRLDNRPLHETSKMSVESKMSINGSIVRSHDTCVACFATLSTNKNDCLIVETLEGNINSKIVVHTREVYGDEKKSTLATSHILQGIIPKQFNTDRLLRCVCEILIGGSNLLLCVYQGLIDAIQKQGMKPLKTVCIHTIGVMIDGNVVNYIHDANKIEASAVDINIQTIIVPNTEMIYYSFEAPKLIPWKHAYSTVEYIWNLYTASDTENKRKAEQEKSSSKKRSKIKSKTTVNTEGKLQ